MSRVLLSIFSILALGFGVLPVYAQSTDTDPLTVSITPNYPGPYQSVTISPSSTLLDLTASQVTISVNGTVIQKGSGTTPAQFQTGGPGTTSTIKVTVVPPGGQTVSKTMVIRPADVALISEPLTTTHPFYAGAALPASEGRIRLIAIPDLRTSSGALIPASSLVYTWRNGDQILQSDSGIGKSVLNATAPVRFRDTTITVTVSTPDSSVVAQGSTTVSPVEPSVRIYQDDPLLGPLFSVALPDSIAMSDTEEMFRGVAYNFAGNPALSWSVNSTQSQNGKTITVRSNGAGAGTAILGFTARNDDTKQTADTATTIQFGANKSLGIFGL